MRQTLIILAAASSLAGCAQVKSAARAAVPAIKRVASCVAECVAGELAAAPAPSDGGVK